MFKGFKTGLVSLALVVLGALQQFDWATIVTTDSAGTVLMVIGGAVGVLRWLTTTPIFSDKPAEQ